MLTRRGGERGRELTNQNKSNGMKSQINSQYVEMV